MVGIIGALGKGWWVGSWDSPTERRSNEAGYYSLALGSINCYQMLVGGAAPINAYHNYNIFFFQD